MLILQDRIDCFMRAAFVVIALCNAAAAAPPDVPTTKSASGADLVLERFKISLDQDGAIVLPVKIGDVTHRFLLDSGASLCAIDLTLVAGAAPVRCEKFDGAEVRLECYAMPEACVGTIRLHKMAPKAAGLDLTKLSEVSGYKVAGILGYDFFESQVLQIDFDQGELRILKGVPANCGERIEVTYPKPRWPSVKLKVADGRTEEFLIDTGATGFESGSLRAELCDALRLDNNYRLVGESLSQTVQGTQRGRLIQGKQITLSSFATERPIFDSDSVNLLGLYYLSRYSVIFDLANHCLYLKRGKRFDQVDLVNRSGLHIARRDGQAVVHSVDRYSPAANSGICADDVILRMSNMPGDKGSLYAMRRALCNSDADVPIVLKRDQKEMKITLHLAPSSPETSK